METQVILHRPIFDKEVRQQSKTGFLCVTDLVTIGNELRNKDGLINFNYQQFVKTKAHSEFKAELENKYGKVINSGRGRNSATWAHPLLFIDIALAISPKLKLEMYEWIADNLIEFRHNSGDSYKRMVGEIWHRDTNSKIFPKRIARVADFIKNSLMVQDWNKANQEQLKNRDKCHEAICLLLSVTNNIDLAVRLGVQEVIKTLK